MHIDHVSYQINFYQFYLILEFSEKIKIIM